MLIFIETTENAVDSLSIVYLYFQLYFMQLENALHNFLLKYILCIYIYVCVCACACVHVCVCICIYIYTLLLKSLESVRFFKFF